MTSKINIYHSVTNRFQMFSPRWQRILGSLGLEFWLPLPLLGLVFWLSGNLLAERVLSRSYGTVSKLQADTQLEIQLSATVTSIQADIFKPQAVTRVAVKTSDSALKKLEFEFPVTESSQLESLIAQELGLPRENIRRLTYYRIQDRFKD